MPKAVNDAITANENTPIVSASVAGNDIPSGDGGQPLVPGRSERWCIARYCGNEWLRKHIPTHQMPITGVRTALPTGCAISMAIVLRHMLSITILHVNNLPVAAAQQITTLEDVPFSGVVIATDVDLDVLTFSKAADPAHGIVTVNANGTYTFTPEADYNGTDSFTITVSDGKGGIATVPVNVTITPCK